MGGPRGTVHLYSSDDPLRDGEDLRANCGTLIKRAVAVAMVDNWLCYGANVVCEEPKFGGCRKCHIQPGKHYIYAIKSALKEEALSEAV